jgi:hypothetical protein
MTSLQRAVTAIAAIPAGDYSQSKAVFKGARARAGLRSPPDIAAVWIVCPSRRSCAFSVMPTRKTAAPVTQAFIDAFTQWMSICCRLVRRLYSDSSARWCAARQKRNEFNEIHVHS